MAVFAHLIEWGSLVALSTSYSVSLEGSPWVMLFSGGTRASIPPPQTHTHFLIIIKLEPTLMETLNLSIGEHLDKSTLDRHGVDVQGLTILAKATIL